MKKVKDENETFLNIIAAELKKQTPIKVSDPKVSKEICRNYSDVVKPGLDATDHALLLSRVLIQARVYRGQ